MTLREGEGNTGAILATRTVGATNPASWAKVTFAGERLSAGSKYSFQITCASCAVNYVNYNAYADGKTGSYTSSYANEEYRFRIVLDGKQRVLVGCRSLGMMPVANASLPLWVMLM